MTRLVIDSQTTYCRDYSRTTGHLPWGRITLNETRLLTYISKEHPLEVVEQVTCLSLNRVRTRGRSHKDNAFSPEENHPKTKAAPLCTTLLHQEVMLLEVFKLGPANH